MRSFFIAEIGVNHENSIDVAIDMVKNAKLAGADAVKFQTYKSSSLAAANSPHTGTFLVSLVLLKENYLTSMNVSSRFIFLLSKHVLISDCLFYNLF